VLLLLCRHDEAWCYYPTNCAVTHVLSPYSTAPKVDASSDDQQEERVLKAACGDVSDVDDDEEDEMEEMFVDAHSSLGHTEREWGGPRRGGRLPEPTRFGDWERKGRCTDF
jgi:hypothetical protein